MWQLAMAFVPVTLVFFAAQAAVLAGSRIAHPDEYPDPFAPYEAMMPGHLIAELEDPPCDLQTLPGNSLVFSCDLQPGSSPIAALSATAYNGEFVQISFNAHDLYIGDVVSRWGKPDVVVRFNYQAFYIVWAAQGLIGIVEPVRPFERFDYMLAVERLTIGLPSRNSP